MTQTTLINDIYGVVGSQGEITDLNVDGKNLGLVRAVTGPGGGNRIPGRYNPITTRPLYPCGYTKAPCRAPALPIGTGLINASVVPGASTAIAVDTDVKFNGRPTTRLTISGVPTGTYAQVETSADTYTLPADAQAIRERTVLCAVKHNALGEPKFAAAYLGNAAMDGFESWRMLYVGGAGDWSIYQQQAPLGPTQVQGAGASQDLSVPRRARMRVDTQATLAPGDMWFAEPYVLPAPTPTVVWTSDDGYAEWTWLAAEAQKRGLRLSFGVSEPYVGQPGFLDAAQVLALQNQYGHEVTNHGGANDTYAAIGLTEYMRRVNSCQDFLLKLGVDPRSANLHQYIQGANDAVLRTAMRDAGYLSARQTASSFPLFPSAGVKLVGKHADALYNISTCASLNANTTLAQAKTAIANTIKAGPAFIVGHQYAASASASAWVNGYDTQYGTLDLMDWLAERRDVDGWRVMTWLEWYDDLFDSQIGVTV